MYYLYNFLAVMLLIFFVLPYFIWRYFREKGFPPPLPPEHGLYS